MLAVVGFAALLVSLSQSVLIPVLPTLPQTLNTSASTVAWLLTATLIVGAVAMPVFGRLADMYGTRRMLLVALAAMALGSLLTAVSSNIGVLIAGRAIQGASLATVSLGISLLNRVLPAERARGAVAVVSAMLGVGGALGMPLAGVIADHADFHALFWITGGSAAVALIAVALVVPEAPGRVGRRIDVVGSLLLAGALVALLLPLSRGAE